MTSEEARALDQGSVVSRAMADHAELNALRVNGFEPLAAARAYDDLVTTLQAIADWASDAGPYKGLGPLSISDMARAALRRAGEPE